MTATITIIDDLHPEDNAMLQALQSRSPATVAERLEKVRAVGSGQFMDTYYVGYGHKSIGDCGNTTIFIEGVTMLVAKAIQDWPLYSGQEASTRFMNFSTAEIHNPLGTADGERIQEDWRKFYLDCMEPVKAHLREAYPRKEEDDPQQYEVAINARAFDVLRGFLPAGASTNLSWSTNLRQAADQLGWLVHHPHSNIREVAVNLLGQLRDKYKASFRDRPLTQEQSDYKAMVMREMFLTAPARSSGLIRVRVNFSFDQLSLSAAERNLLSSRPEGVEVPRFLAERGSVTSEFMLDFGSYRDLQRHRAGVIRMPLLTPDHFFNAWYLDELPLDIRYRAVRLIRRQTEAIQALDCDDVTRQDYCAMGFQVPCRVTQGLPAFIYRLEIRSAKTVHPSLRRVIHQEIRHFRAAFPDAALYVDEDPNSWTVRRGKQTITEKT